MFDGILGWLVAGIGAVVAIAATYFGVKRSGKAEAVQEAAARKAESDAATTAHNQQILERRVANDEAVRTTDDAALRERLRAYARKD